MQEQLELSNEFPRHYRWARSFLLRRLAAAFECYHPVFLRGNSLSAGQRSCVDRWQMMRPMLEECETLLDIGCAEGFFAQQAAREGIISLGVDADVRRLTMATETMILNGVKNCGFLYAEVTPELIHRLPASDAVIFLSVLHHIIYGNGLDYAREFMRAIHGRTRRWLIFDTGQSNEKEHTWSNLLPDMGLEPAVWISGFLKECGFTEILQIGATDAYRGATQRLLFAAKP